MPCLKSLKSFYVVLCVYSGRVLYDKNNLARAAESLSPASCFGQGSSREEALSQAEQVRQSLLKRGYSLPKMQHSPS